MKLGIVNTKGGVGKTTTAVYLAAAALARGLTVQVQDLDKQGSITGWLDPLMPVEGLTLTAANSYTVKRASAADLTILDTGPSDQNDVETVAAVADFVIVPSSPGGLNDARTTVTVNYLASKNVPHAVLLVQTKARTGSTRDSRENLLEHTSVFDTEIPDREAIRKRYGQWPAELHGYDELLTEIQNEVAAK
jgi:chromosome partitioning protein